MLESLLVIDLLKEKETNGLEHNFPRLSLAGQKLVSKWYGIVRKVENNFWLFSVVSGSRSDNLQSMPTTGFLRFYYPILGRWVSRDPIGVNGGVNLFEICNNNLISQYDLFGMSILSSIMFVYTDADPVKDADWYTIDPKTQERIYHHKDASGRLFRGRMTTYGNPEGHEYDVQGGGRIEPKSHVKKPDDTPVPSGTYQVDTQKNGLIGYLLHDVPNRGDVEIHAGNISTGCITIEDEDSWDKFDKDMCETNAAGHKTISVTISYRMSAGQALPNGNRGPGTHDNGGNPPPPDQMGPPSPKWPGWND